MACASARHADYRFRIVFRRHDVVRNCLLTFADFRRVAVEYCADEAAQGTSYAEVSFTAAAHGERLGDMAMPLRAVAEVRAQLESGIGAWLA
jgi:adenosine deaminase